MSLSAVAVRNQRKKQKELPSSLQLQQQKFRGDARKHGPGSYKGVAALLVADFANIKVGTDGQLLGPAKLTSIPKSRRTSKVLLFDEVKWLIKI